MRQLWRLSQRADAGGKGDFVNQASPDRAFFPDRPTHLGGPDAPAQALARLLERTFDPHIGLIRFIAEIGMQPDEPPLHLAVAEHQNPFLVPPRSLDIVDGDIPQGSVMGTGSALDPVTALWSTVGEAIERYALHVYDRDALLFAPQDALDGAFLSPSDMILFASHQFDDPAFKFRRYDPERPIAWARGMRLGDGSPAYIPACMAYLGYRTVSPNECIDAGYSTGGAAGPNLEAALLSGMLEVIERDGFACHWYLRRTPPEIDLADYREELPPKLVRVLDECSLKLRLFDLTTDLGVPTVLAVGLPARGGIAIGASARPDFGTAIEKATLEALHTFNWIAELRRSGDRIERREDVRAYRDHVLWHLSPERARSFDFILQPERRPERLPTVTTVAATHAERLDALVGRLRDCGFETFGLDLTPEEISDLDIRVARAFVPGLHPLGAGAGNEHLDRRRLQRFADHVGMPMPDELNLDLHPFP